MPRIPTENEPSTGGAPVVLITGAAGGIGTALSHALSADYTIVGLDHVDADQVDASYRVDLTDAASVAATLSQVRRAHGGRIAAVVHLAAYFDFSGEPSPLYESVNVTGTAHLLDALSSFDVDRFIYASTMLVHAPGTPGSRIDESSPIGPRWIYPQSKARAEAAIQRHAGDMPYTLLRLAGLYDDRTCVPTLAHQISRIYERNLQSHLYSGDPDAGQAFVHQDDMIEAFRATIERRHELPKQNVLLIGEDESPSYEALQQRIGTLIHGEAAWRTFTVPQAVAKTGAWLQEKAEPLIPDAFDHGEKPFIRPFMIDLAADHYELDTRRAAALLGWRARHNILDGLDAIIAHLQRDAAGWYRANGITPPDWVDSAAAHGRSAADVLALHDRRYRAEHREYLWAHWGVMALGAWLITAPATLGYTSVAMTYSDIVAGLAALLFGGVSLSWRHGWARWASAAVGMWLLFAPLLFWAPSAAAYLNGTLVGMLLIGLAAATPPAPGISPAAATGGPVVPPGWDNNPSGWLQRMPIILLAFVGFFISRYLAAYQLGHIDAVWDPFFAGTRPGLNGTEDVITSAVSAAWPIPDAGAGGMLYALEILVGLVGGTQRWRTMPWIVALFGFMIVPLGTVSILFIIIQPIVIGTWCALCLIAAGAMLLQIAYVLNEFVATGQFLRRRRVAGRPLLKIFFTGDIDDGGPSDADEDFERSPGAILTDAFTTGVGAPWNLVLCVLIGVWLMFTRVTLGTEGGMADWDHLVGALVITVAVIGLAEVARPIRWLLMPLGAALLVTPFVYGVDWVTVLASVTSGAAIIGLAVRRGPIRYQYGSWNDRLR